MYDTLILSGGGLLIVSIASCLKKLSEKIDFSNITSYHGTSSGSILSFLMCLGISPKSILKILDNFHFENIMQIEPEQFANLLDHSGILSTTKIRDKLQIVCNVKFDIDDITFAELFEKTGKTLNIYATNLTKQKCVVFNHQNTPDMSVLLAIQMSCCIPIIFEQIEYNGDIYVDGFLCANFPTPEIVDQNKTLGIMICPKKQNLLCHPKDPFWTIYSMYLSMSIYMRYSMKAIKRNTNYDIIIINGDVDIYLTNEKKRNYRNNGIQSAILFLEKFEDSKRKEEKEKEEGEKIKENDLPETNNDTVLLNENITITNDPQENSLSHDVLKQSDIAY